MGQSCEAHGAGEFGRVVACQTRLTHPTVESARPPMVSNLHPQIFEPQTRHIPSQVSSLSLSSHISNSAFAAPTTSSLRAGPCKRRRRVLSPDGRYPRAGGGAGGPGALDAWGAGPVLAAHAQVRQEPPERPDLARHSGTTAARGRRRQHVSYRCSHGDIKERRRRHAHAHRIGSYSSNVCRGESVPR